MNILITNGVGFVGRHLSVEIRKRKLAKNLCIVDKRLPEMVYLSEEMTSAIGPHFQQVDMCNPQSADRIFKLQKWDWVFNLQSELPFDADDYFFEVDIYKRSLVLAQKAAECGVQCFIHCSGTEIYKSSSKLQDEDAELSPSTRKGKWVLKTEQALRAISGLKLMILRPALIWGPHCTTEYTTYLALGSIHRYLGEDLIYPMHANSKKSMIHVLDVVEALLYLPAWYQSNRKAETVVYNLASPSGYREGQSSITPAFKALFDVELRFLSKLELLGFKYNIESIVDELNDKFLKVWAQMLREGDIKNTPLSPYICIDFVKMDGIAGDGRRVEIETGFRYEIHEYSAELGIRVYDDFIDRGLYPRVIGKGQVQPKSSSR